MKKMLIIVIVLFYLIVWDNNRIIITAYKISANANLKIAQLSDIHDVRIPDKTIDKLKGVDVIVITGDMIDEDLDAARANLERLTELAPVYFVSGNHEMASLCYESFKELCKSLNVKILNNETVKIRDVYLSGKCEESSLFPQPKDGYNILLAHHPEYINTYLDYDLVLCGHAHGGQVRIPFYGGLYSPGQGFHPKYSGGKYKIKNTTMIVNRGIGGPKPRINNTPEICIIEVINEAQKKKTEKK